MLITLQFNQIKNVHLCHTSRIFLCHNKYCMINYDHLTVICQNTVQHKLTPLINSQSSNKLMNKPLLYNTKVKVKLLTKRTRQCRPCHRTVTQQLSEIFIWPIQYSISVGYNEPSLVFTITSLKRWHKTRRITNKLRWNNIIIIISHNCSCSTNNSTY